jgi:hypothetical protein
VLRWILFAAAPALTACVSVADSNPALWSQTHDLGGADARVPGLGTGGTPGTAGTGGAALVAGAGGQSTTPGAGGAPAAGGKQIVPGGAGAGAGGAAGIGAGGGVPTGTGGQAPGAGGVAGAGSGGTPPGTGGMITGNSGKCTFTFDASTVTAKGRYAPSNAGAVWITDAQSKFVKTLQTWSLFEIQQVTAWVQASGRNTTDAVTGATRRSDGPLTTSKWDCTDVSHAAVPDGKYTVHVSFAESDANPFFGGTPIEASVDFTKSTAGADAMGQDTANFKSLHAKLSIP